MDDCDYVLSPFVVFLGRVVTANESEWLKNVKDKGCHTHNYSGVLGPFNLINRHSIF